MSPDPRRALAAAIAVARFESAACRRARASDLVPILERIWPNGGPYDRAKALRMLSEAERMTLVKRVEVTSSLFEFTVSVNDIDRKSLTNAMCIGQKE